MNTVRLGVIGIGNMGTSHCKKVLEGQCPDFTLTAICDKDPARIQWAKENFDAPITYFEDAEELLCSGLIDACIVAVPHYDHPGLAMACMKKGIHVLVEKPAGVYTKQVREMNECARHHNVAFAMMFNQRTNHIYRKMRELVQSGKYGQIRRTNWLITNWYRSQCYYDSGSWRATWAGEGGGVLLNQCPHQLDLWQWICGMPEAVSAHCDLGKYHNIEVEDAAIVFARFPGGATGCFTTSTGEFPGTNRLEIVGTLGKLVIEDGKLKWWRLQQDEREFCKSCPVSHGKIPFTYEEFDHVPISGHRLILEDFARAVLKGTPLLAPVQEGILSLSIQNAAYLSSWKDGAWISLPFDEEDYDRLLAQRRTNAVPHSDNTAALNHSYDQRWQINW